MWFADRIFLARVKNVNENVQAWQANIKSKGITNPKPVNPKVLFPYLEAIQFENEPELRKMWANLMTNYVDPTKNLMLTVYPQILKQLSSNEILVLTHMITKGSFHLVSDAKLLKSSGEISNLERLGHVRNRLELKTYGSTQNQYGSVHSDLQIEEVGSDAFNLTCFGWDFMLACGVS